MAIELKEGMTLVCKTANGKIFKVGEKYPVVKNDRGKLYIKSEYTRWFNDEIPYLEDCGDTFEVLPYTPDLSKLKEVECVAENLAACSFMKGEKYKVHENIMGKHFIITEMNTRFYQQDLENLAITHGIRFDEPKPKQEPKQEPVTELKTGATLVCTSNNKGKACYFTVGKKYPVIRATRCDGTSEKCIESDTGTKWWNDEIPELLKNSGLVFQEYTGEQPEPEFNYTVKAANLKELNAVLYSAYQYTKTMLKTNDKLEDYQREHDIAKENLEELFK